MFLFSKLHRSCGNLNDLSIATSYNEAEIIKLEDKLKFVNQQSKQIEQEISNLMIVKDSMRGAIQKFKEDKDIKNKRVDIIKQQSEQLKQQYKTELEQVKQDEFEFNKSHQEFLNLSDYYRNAVLYVKEKYEFLRKGHQTTRLPSLNKDLHQSEKVNVIEKAKEDSPNTSIFDDHPLKKVKSTEALPKKNFLKHHMKKRIVFSPSRPSPPNLVIPSESKIKSTQSKLTKSSQKLVKLKNKTSSVLSKVHYLELLNEERDQEVRAMNLRIAEVKRFIMDGKRREVERKEEERRDEIERVREMHRQRAMMKKHLKGETYYPQHNYQNEGVHEAIGQEEAQEEVMFFEFKGRNYVRRDSQVIEQSDSEQKDGVFLTQQELPLPIEEAKEVEETTLEGTIQNPNSDLKKSNKVENIQTAKILNKTPQKVPKVTLKEQKIRDTKNKDIKEVVSISSSSSRKPKSPLKSKIPGIKNKKPIQSKMTFHKKVVEEEESRRKNSKSRKMSSSSSYSSGSGSSSGSSSSGSNSSEESN
jgi:uncharacterized membrane protein YgcG